VIIIQNSLLNVFDPNDPEYAGLREHFGQHELEKIDELRARPKPSSFSFADRLFICWALDKAVMSAENP
jgi:hypothetical protein